MTGDIAPDDSVEELLEKLRTAHIDALDQTMRLLAPGALGQAVDLLTAADRVLCMGQEVQDPGHGGVPPVCQHLFQVSMCPGFPPAGHGRRPAGAEGCIALFLLLRLHKGYSGYHVHCPPARMQVHSNHPFPKSPGAVYADVVLQCGATEGPLQMGSVAAGSPSCTLWTPCIRSSAAGTRRQRSATGRRWRRPWCASIFEELLRQAAFRSKGPPAQGGGGPSLRPPGRKLCGTL